MFGFGKKKAAAPTESTATADIYVAPVTGSTFRCLKFLTPYFRRVSWGMATPLTLHRI